jgi:hypothetical protein
MKKAADNTMVAERAIADKRAADVAAEKKVVDDAMATERDAMEAAPGMWLSPLLLQRRELRGSPYLVTPPLLPRGDSVAPGCHGMLWDAVFAFSSSMFILFLLYPCSKRVEPKPPYVCQGRSNHTYNNNMIIR